MRTLKEYEAAAADERSQVSLDYRRVVLGILRTGSVVAKLHVEPRIRETKEEAWSRVSAELSATRNDIARNWRVVGPAQVLCDHCGTELLELDRRRRTADGKCIVACVGCGWSGLMTA